MDVGLQKNGRFEDLSANLSLFGLLSVKPILPKLLRILFDVDHPNL